MVVYNLASGPELRHDGLVQRGELLRPLVGLRVLVVLLCGVGDLQKLVDLVDLAKDAADVAGEGEGRSDFSQFFRNSFPRLTCPE